MTGSFLGAANQIEVISMGNDGPYLRVREVQSDLQLQRFGIGGCEQASLALHSDYVIICYIILYVLYNCIRISNKSVRGQHLHVLHQGLQLGLGLVDAFEAKEGVVLVQVELGDDDVELV